MGKQRKWHNCWMEFNNLEFEGMVAHPDELLKLFNPHHLATARRLHVPGQYDDTYLIYKTKRTYDQELARLGLEGDNIVDDGSRGFTYRNRVWAEISDFNYFMTKLMHRASKAFRRK